MLNLPGGLILIYTFITFRRRPRRFLFDAVLFGFVGFIGLFLTWLWGFTDHQAADNNLNVLWAMPLNIPVLIWWAFVPANRRLLRGYFLVYGLLTALLLVLWYALPQDLNGALFLLIAAVAARAFYVAYNLNRST